MRVERSGVLGSEYYGRNVRRVDIEGFERLLSHGDPALPVVVANGREFVSLAYYAPRQVTSRLVALLDPQAALERTGTDSIELDIEVLQRYLPIAVQSYEASEAAHARFLLYATPGHGEWWQARLLRDGFTLQTLAADGSRVLYEVTQVVDTSAFVGPLEPGLLEWLAVRRTADRRYPTSSRRSSVGRAAHS